jgi:hypothetical protein
MERTDLTCDLDGALSGRNAGSKGFWEIARGGNGRMTDDLMAEDDGDYEELAGLGEVIEEMDPAESAGEDAGDPTAFKPFREARADEVAPYAPKHGRGWVRRRIRTGNRAPGGRRQVRSRWAMVSPHRWVELKKNGQVKPMNGLGLFGASPMTMAAVGVGVGLALSIWLSGGRRKQSKE